LEDWANTREDGVKRLLKIHAEEIDIPKPEFKDTTAARMEAAFVEDSVRRIAESLRKAWDAPDDRRFDWYVWKAVSIAQSQWQMFDFMEDPPERATTIEAVAFYLLHNRRRALHCANRDCTAPYFFQQKKGQKFCSMICALPSQRESKRKWWAENRTKKKEKNK